MTQFTLEKKIEILSKRHRSHHPEAIQQITEWENRIAELQVQADWLSHPNTRELREIAEEQLRLISSTLAEDESLSELERKVLFAMKGMHRVYLSLLDGDPNAEIRTIEEKVDIEFTP